MGIQQPLFRHRFEWHKMPDALQRSIEALPEAVLLADDKATLATLTRDHWLEVPQLDLPGVDEHVGDATVRTIAFTGSALLFSLQPLTITDALPEGTVIGDRLLLSTKSASEGADAQTYFSHQEQLLTQWLTQGTMDVAEHNARVDRAAFHLFEQRRQASWATHGRAGGMDVFALPTAE